MLEINYWAVLVAALVSMILGGMWYGPLFGKLWMKGMGWDPSDKELMEKMKKKAGPAYVQQLIGSIIMAFTLAYVIAAFAVAIPQITGALAGIQAGFCMWLGFVLPVKYGDKLWGGKNFKYVGIDLGYYLVLLMAMGVILSVWQA